MADPTWAFDGLIDERTLAFFKTNRVFLSHPFSVRGPYWPGTRIQIAAGLQVERFATLPPRHFCNMGAYSYCISGKMPPSARIGRYCSLAQNVRVMAPGHPVGWVTTRAFPHTPGMPTPPAVPEPEHRGPFIGNDVWIGQDVLLAPDVTINDGAIVAAGSVVTEDVPAYAIAGGVEAKVIRPRFADERIAERMQAVQWWRYNYADFGGLPMDQPEVFLDGLEARIADGSIAPFKPGVVLLGEALADWMAQPA